MFSIPFGPGHSANQPWPFMWSYGHGQVVNSATGQVSAHSHAFEAGSFWDGAGVGFLFNVTTERLLFLTATLTGDATVEASGIWGYASAEPMFDLWLFGMDANTRWLNTHYEVGVGLRATAGGFGYSRVARPQTRTVSPTLSAALPPRTPGGTIFAGAGVKTYAGCGGFLCDADATMQSTIKEIRITGI